ncbi:Cyclin-like protein [Dioscorea alata]|uniref:Cyclin-like protein n=1 Tax=Dioscorea alata TaxID=55571 RepID=A0ACB7V542_DIOAL|nr:Cyclin-like protein [Dioscorea alata]
MAEEWESSKVYPRVVTTLSSLLQRVVEINESSSSSTTKPLLSVWTTTNNEDEAKEEEEKKKKNSSVFHGVRKPGISIKKYLERIFKYAGCSPACFVVAYVYLDRFTRHCPNLSIDSFNVHRLLITTVLLATKFLDDIYYNNAYFAKVGGISMAEMNLLEINFLFGIQFELNVTPSLFSSYCSILENEMSFESPNAGPRLHCFISEEETNICKQKQLAQSNSKTTMQCS